MAPQRFEQGGHDRAEFVAPTGVLADLDIGEELVPHGRHQLVLVLDVPVERHRGNPEVHGNSTHGNRGQTLGIRD